MNSGTLFFRCWCRDDSLSVQTDPKRLQRVVSFQVVCLRPQSEDDLMLLNTSACLFHSLKFLYISIKSVTGRFLSDQLCRRGYGTAAVAMETTPSCAVTEQSADRRRSPCDFSQHWSSLIGRFFQQCSLGRRQWPLTFLTHMAKSMWTRLSL